MTDAAMSIGPESAATKAERPGVHSGEPIPFNDLRIQWREIAASVQREFKDVFATPALFLCAPGEAFERENASYLRPAPSLPLNPPTPPPPPPIIPPHTPPPH